MQKKDVLENLAEKETEIHKEAQEQQAKGSTNTSEDVAAQLFQLYHPMFTNIVAKLSNKQLRRVINALIKYPIEMENYKPKDENENNAYLIGDRLLQSKYVMMIFTAQDAMNQMKVEDVVQQTTETNNEPKGETNGQ